MKTAKTPGGWLVGLALAFALAGPAGAEVKVYLLDRTEPVVTAEVFEEGPWLFYREGESPYLLTVARDRVERLEIVRDSAVQTLQITPPGQAAFPDARRQILLTVAGIQDARVEELRKVLEEEVSKIGAAASAVNQAREAAGILAAVEALQAMQIQRERADQALRQYNQARRGLDHTLGRVEVYRAAGPTPRYYFYR